jgi:hypothetical protein
VFGVQQDEGCGDDRADDVGRNVAGWVGTIGLMIDCVGGKFTETVNGVNQALGC